MQGKGVYFYTPRMGYWQERIPLGLPPRVTALDWQSPRDTPNIANHLHTYWPVQLHSRGLLYLLA